MNMPLNERVDGTCEQAGRGSAALSGQSERYKGHPSISLDVVIPTYNRCTLLRRAIDSLLDAERPAGLQFQITVVDNNSTDETRRLAMSLVDRLEGRLRYVFEKQQGRSSALNAGIATGSSDLVGFIDDDEEVHPSWLTRVHSAFTQGEVDFIGGPYLPNWGAPPPDWLPRDYPAVIGWIEGSDRAVPFGEQYPGILMGGNAVLTRSILQKVGLYDPALSRTGTRLLAGEDDDMYRRLLAAGARGYYLPDLIIYHHIPAERLTKRYFRRWCFWRGVSSGFLDRDSPSNVTYLAGVPRWMYGKAVRGLMRTVNPAKRFLRRPEAFSGELALWDLAGFFYGKHVYDPPVQMKKDRLDAGEQQPCATSQLS